MKDAVRALKALADPTRMRIVLLLADHDLCVCELMAVLRIEQSLLSHQLRLLRNAGLVARRKVGRWIIYSLPCRVRDGLVRPIASFAGTGLSASRGVSADARRVEACLRDSVRRKGRPARERSGRAR